MPSLAEATKPLDLSSYETVSAPSGVDAPPLPTNPPSPNPFLRSPLPASLGLSPDTLRQFYNGANPQYRLLPLAPAANAASGAQAASQAKTLIEQITTASPGVTSLDGLTGIITLKSDGSVVIADNSPAPGQIELSTATTEYYLLFDVTPTDSGDHKTFTLPQTPVGMVLCKNGVELKLGVDYSQSGTTTTLASALASGDVLYAPVLFYIGTSDFSFVFNVTPVDTGDHKNFTLPEAASAVVICKNGIDLTLTTDYTLSGATITLASALDPTFDSLFVPVLFNVAARNYSYLFNPTVTDSGDHTNFTLSQSPVGLVLCKNGVVLKKGVDYTLATNTITLASALNPAVDSLSAPVLFY